MQKNPAKISSKSRRALARASTIAAGGKFVSASMKARHPARPITLRLVKPAGDRP